MKDNGRQFIFNRKYMEIESLFSPFQGFGYAPKCCNYGLDTSKFFMFLEKENFKEDVLDFLLGSELKKIFDYNKMQLDLPENNKITKKIKM